MSKGAVSIFVFGLYLLLVGPVLVLVPNLLLSVFAIPETSEVWIRVLGVVAAVLGYYYVVAARNEQTAFFRATVPGRLAVLVCFSAFVVMKMTAPTFLIFGVIDALGALWTALALREHS
jgi:hypothetical protein